jgi:hypothetical protein
MLHLITGVPGSCKTAFVVTELDKVEKSNKVNLVKNIEIYNKNKPLMEQFHEDFSYREYEVGSGHELQTKMEILPNDFFDFLGQEFDDLRPDYYFQRVVYCNEIIDRINKREGEQGFEHFLPVRTIYTNINALKIDYVRALTYDWRDCPDGSIIVIDEVQLVEPYSDIKSRDNPIVQSLTVHRHRGFDFYFITQAPSLLHPTVKVLIGVHYHLTRPYGMTTVVYRYGSCKDNPNAIINRQNREAKFNFKPQDRIFKLYKSTTINTHKKRFPKGIWFFLAWVIAGIALFIYNLSGDELSNSAVLNENKAPNTIEATDITTDKALNQGNTPQTDKDQDEPKPELTKEQLEKLLKLQEQQFDLRLEEQRLQIIMQYDELQRQLVQHQKQLDDFYRTIELYKTMLPKDHEIIKANPDLQVRGVIKTGTKCSAYNREGVLMTLTPEQCSYYTEATGRVWKNGQTTDNSPSTPRYPPTLTDNSTRTVIPSQPQEQVSAPQEQSNNVVANQ